jgi:hypothetical protein
LKIRQEIHSTSPVHFGRRQAYRQFDSRKSMRKTSAIAVLPFFLAACGGGSDGANSSNSSSATATTSSIVLSGQVSDGPIDGAQVCLLSDGVPVRDAAGAAPCSSPTDAQGNFSLSIPRSLAPGFLSLVASKGGAIRLASALGTLSQVSTAADANGVVAAASLPALRISHLTTADYVLADADHDGTVTKSELDAYVSSYASARPVAAVVKAVIDYGQAGSLIGGQTTDTLALAAAAARNQTLGTSGQTAAQWTADAANAGILAAVDQDAAAGVTAGFADYRLSTVVTSYDIPPAATSNGSASIYCHIDTSNETATVQLAFDAARGIVILKHDDVQAVGSYNAQTGAISIDENDPLAVSASSPSVTYYSEGYFRLRGTRDAAGNLAGSYSEMTANTWSLDATREVCTAQGSITATKL